MILAPAASRTPRLVAQPRAQRTRAEPIRIVGEIMSSRSLRGRSILPH